MKWQKRYHKPYLNNKSHTAKCRRFKPHQSPVHILHEVLCPCKMIALSDSASQEATATHQHNNVDNEQQSKWLVQGQTKVMSVREVRMALTCAGPCLIVALGITLYVWELR